MCMGGESTQACDIKAADSTKAFAASAVDSRDLEAFAASSVERVFDLLTGLGDAGRWASVQTSELGHELLLETGSFQQYGQPRIRMEAIVDLPLEVAVDLIRPEVVFHPDGPGFRLVSGPCALFSQYKDIHVQHVHAPGDITVRACVRGARAAKCVALNCAFSEGLSELGGLCIRQSIRMVLRRDFPRPGMWALAEVLGTGVVQSGFQVARALCLSAGAKPGTTSLSYMRLHPRVEGWLSVCAPWPKKAQFWQAQFDQAASIVGTPRCVSVRESTRHVVVGLRRCRRGPPILPIGVASTGALQWETTSTSRPLHAYLNQFLELLGEQGEFTNSLDGWRLPPYQAAVRADAWERSWAALEGPYKIQRTVYRRRCGGTGAPELHLHVEPKLLELLVQEDDEASAPPRPALELSTAGGFLTLRPPPGLLLRPRVGSWQG